MASGKERTGFLLELDNDVWAELNAVAEKEDRTKKAVIQRALRVYFDSIKAEAKQARAASKQAPQAA